MTSIALVVDDHELFRVGLAALLKKKCGFAEVVQAGSFDEAVEILAQTSGITLATFDLAMPGMSSISSLRGLRESFRQLQIVIVTGSSARQDIIAALEAGVHGFILKTLDLDAILNALRSVLAGNVFVPSEILSLEALPNPPGKEDGARAGKLTARQLEIARYVAFENKSNKEIARALNLTENTVKVHLNAIFRTLNIHERRQIAAAVERMA